MPQPLHIELLRPRAYTREPNIQPCMEWTSPPLFLPRQHARLYSLGKRGE